MSIKTEFEKAFYEENINLNLISPDTKIAAEWGARWMAERCVKQAIDYTLTEVGGAYLTVQDLRQLAKELSDE